MPKKKDVKKDDDEGDDDEKSECEDADNQGKSREFSLIHSGKLGFFVFLLFVLLMSDVFIERVMARSGVDLVSGRVPTKKGIIVQGILLTMGLIALDFLISQEKL